MQWQRTLTTYLRSLFSQIGLAGFVKAIRDRGASAVLVDCSPPALTAGLLASAWNVPMVGFQTTSPDLSNHTKYSTFVRVFPPFSMVMLPLRALFNYYNWTTCSMIKEIVTDPNLLYLSYMQQGIEQNFTDEELTATMSLHTDFTDNDIANALLSVARVSRSKSMLIIVNKE